jgi:hypothetical protein
MILLGGSLPQNLLKNFGVGVQQNALQINQYQQKQKFSAVDF